MKKKYEIEIIKSIICISMAIFILIFTSSDIAYANNEKKDNNEYSEVIEYSIKQDEIISYIVDQYMETNANTEWKEKLYILEKNYDSIILKTNDR